MKTYFHQMRLGFVISIFCLITTLASGTTFAETAKNELHFLTDFAEAKSESKKTGKPLFIYFSGSDWCDWCKKMDSEIFASKEFITLVGNKFIFVDIDTPIYKTLDPKLVKQNDELKAQYKIHGFPTIILLDPQENEKPFATLIYREGGGKAYAEYLLQILRENEEFKHGVKNLGKQNSAALEKLYVRSFQLGMTDTTKKILQAGLKTSFEHNDSYFFLKEQYRNLLSDGKIASVEAKSIREKLLGQDPYNKLHLQYDVAILDFEALSKNLANDENANEVIKPLQDYLAKFGSRDVKHRWKIEMTISQVLRSKNQNTEALKYAKASHKNAPAYLRQDIATAISELEQDASAIGDAR